MKENFSAGSDSNALFERKLTLSESDRPGFES